MVAAHWLTTEEADSLELVQSKIHPGTYYNKRYYDTIASCGLRGWYFIDETGAGVHGPHPTCAIARDALQAYAETL